MFWAIEKGLDYIPKVNVGPTVAVSIGASVGSYRGMVAIRETGGLDVAVTEDEIKHAYRQLSRREGLFVEPSSAAAIAGALQMGRDGVAGRDSTVVCISSSGGLKDPKTAASGLAEVPVIEPDFERFLRAVKDSYGVDL
jgi:threonine synthase